MAITGQGSLLSLSFLNPYCSKFNDFEFTQDAAQADLPPNDAEIMNRYSDAFRFGDKTLYGFNPIFYQLFS